MAEKAIGEVFPEEYKQPFLGLLYVGAMTKTVEYAGHKIALKTLTQGEELRVGQLTREYVGCRNEISALKLYTVAAAVQSVVSRQTARMARISPLMSAKMSRMPRHAGRKKNAMF